MDLFFFLALIITAVVGVNWFLRSLKEKRLLEKYHDQAIVAALMSHSYWEGQTAEQLVDSLGHPVDIDRKVMKTRQREIWKYKQTSKKRFALRITLDDGIVVGWDKKSA